MSEDEILKTWKESPMLKPKIEKVSVNISVGKSGEPLEKASKVLRDLTSQNPCKRKAKQTIRDFGIRKGEPTACVVTLRKQKATEFLRRLLPIVENSISKDCFDEYGNFSFGIREHIEIPGVKYEPEVGIFGMNVSVSLSRPGYRVKKRRRKKAKVGSKHMLTPEDAMVFVKEALGVKII